MPSFQLPKWLEGGQIEQWQMNSFLISIQECCLSARMAAHHRHFLAHSGSRVEAEVRGNREA